LDRRSFVIEWPSLGVKVVADGLDHNKDMREWFIDCLPVEAVQGHAMVSGELLYVMNLAMKMDPPRRYHDLVTELFTTQPVGRVNLFATAGRIGSIMVKYGLITEPMRYPTIAQVRKQDIPELVKAGRAEWNSIYNTKEVIKVVFRERRDGE
jgi:hypothetical protein